MLVKAFYESRGYPPGCDERLIAIIKQSGRIEDSHGTTVRIQEEWRDLPRRIQAVLRNEDLVQNDKYEAIREYVEKDLAFFKRFEITQHAVDVLPKVRPRALTFVAFTCPHFVLLNICL